MKHWLTALALVWWLPCPAAPPDDARPQLTAEQAQRRTVADYLGAGPQPWEPAPIDVAALQPDLVVAADGSGSHRTLQAAIDALPAPTSGARRQVILVRPGTYRGQVCARDKVPFVLHGLPGQAAATVLVAGHYAGQSKRADIDAANPCEPALAQSRYGTSGSASVALYGDDIVMAHLTVANDAMDRVAAGAGAPAGVDLATGAQAVALMLRGDRILLEHVRLIGHQDTLYVKAPAPGAPARMLMRHSLIAGDVDFVFGNATLVIDNSVLLSRAGRTGGRGIVLAPSTLPGQDYGFLVIRSRLLAEPGVGPAAVALGRAWDQGVPRGQWIPGVSPNGHAVVRDSELGAHLGPWVASTSQRPFATQGEAANRLFEYRNRAASGPTSP